MNAVKKEVVNQTAEQQQAQAEAQELENRMKVDRERLKQLRQAGKGVTCSVTPTKKGSVGFVINGLGIGKFFYKQQAFSLLEDTEEAYALRQSILQWIADHAEELTDKE